MQVPENPDVRLIVWNGFDRSGTSWLLRLVGEHQSVRALYQPFSGTEVHESQQEVWGGDHHAPRSEHFLRELLDGRFLPDFSGRDLVHRHSRGLDRTTASHFVVKETKLHLKADWLAARVPEAELWAVVRDPRGILHSLCRNGFDETWYGMPAYEALAASIRKDPALAAYRDLLGWPQSAREATALVLAVRSHYFLERVPEHRRLVYEDFVRDPDAALARFCHAVDLPPVSVAAVAKQDANVSGRPFESADGHLGERRSPREAERELALFRSLALLECEEGVLVR